MSSPKREEMQLDMLDLDLEFQCDCCCKTLQVEDECEPGYGVCTPCNNTMIEEDRIDKANIDKWQG